MAIKMAMSQDQKLDQRKGIAAAHTPFSFSGSQVNLPLTLSF
jgi:hypothetical protein